MDLSFDCEFCGQHLEADISMAGSQVVCPTCQNTIVIPNPVGQNLKSNEDFDSASYSEGYYEEETRINEREANWNEPFERRLEEIKMQAHQDVEQTKQKWKLGCLIAVIIYLVIGAMCHKGEPDSSSSGKTTGWGELTDNCIGFRNSSDYSKSTDLAVSGDDLAWKMHNLQCLGSGRAIFLEAGTKVYIEDCAILAERLLVRKEGSTDSYWIPRQLVK